MESRVKLYEKRKVAEFYKTKVATKFGDGPSHTAVDVGNFQESIGLHQQTMVITVSYTHLTLPTKA